jgi:predicted DNA binding CopG/RHH family protein
MTKKEGPPFGSRNAAKNPENFKPVTIRLLPAQLDKLKAVAAAKGISYNVLIRLWIDGLEASK